MKHPPTTYTIGYQGMTLDSFLASLRSERIDCLVDIREVALSRKRGFSKTALSGHLEDAGIRYTHIRALGCPKPIRDQYRLDGNWMRYVRGFTAHLATQGAVINDLIHLLRTERCSLMCFEADYTLCHRSLVAREIGGAIFHLTASGTVREARAAVA